MVGGSDVAIWRFVFWGGKSTHRVSFHHLRGRPQPNEDPAKGHPSGGWRGKIGVCLF